jgi:hypothetical protein
MIPIGDEGRKTHLMLRFAMVTNRRASYSTEYSVVLGGGVQHVRRFWEVESVFLGR